MAEKLNVKKTSYSLAVVAGIVYLACAILVAIAPVWTVSVFGALFHGIDISKIAITPTLGRAALGFIEIIILGFIIGWLYAKIYNSIKE